MNFLNAQRMLKEFKGGPEFSLVLAMSGTSEPLHLYLEAAAAALGREAKIDSLPFNTLGHALRTAPVPGRMEAFILFPWDFAGALDWRSGVLPAAVDLDELLKEAREVLGWLSARPEASLAYQPAPLPPVFSSASTAAAFEAFLLSELGFMNAAILSREIFSPAGLFSSGCPISGQGLGEVGETIINLVLSRPPAPKKLLVSDLDNVMWRGVVAEDGPQALEFGPTGGGYPHFVYQSLLKRLRNDGTLLACVSRNDPDVARQPFELPEMCVSSEDFITIIASYNAKSAQIEALAAEFNLGLQDVVFVDDNPVEIEEVSSSLPLVNCRQFPESAGDFSNFITELAGLFTKEIMTEEDRRRTEMYRLRLADMVPVDANGSDLEAFLTKLEMKLEICDRSTGDRTRAVQLINKTNQFNLNGLRWSDEEIAAVLEGGGHLYTATLRDRNGSHGEILACLIDSGWVVRSWVLSCRVFQRYVEYAFLYWLLGNANTTGFDFSQTERNEPTQRFFADPAFDASDNGLLTVGGMDLAISAEEAARVMEVETVVP